MVCDPGPVFRFAKDHPDFPEAQFAKDAELKRFPIRLLQGVQRHVDAEGGVPVRGGLLDALSRVGKFLRQSLLFALPPFLIQEQVSGNGAQPGRFVGFSPEIASL